MSDQKKAQQQFFTPPYLAVRVIRAADVQPGHFVLEPSAGEGALAEAAEAAGGRVDCIELDAALVAVLRGKGYATRCVNFLHVDPEPVYDRVVMNPPFTKGADLEHVQRAFKFLKPGGVLAAIVGAGVQFRTTAAHREFATFVKENGTVEPLPEGSFVEAGTAVRTVLVVVRKGSTVCSHV